MTEAVPTAEDLVTVTTLPTLPPPLGCSHYQRKCQLVSPCCDLPYNCRFCHDEESTNHTLDRRSVKEVVCLVCSARQALSNLCTSKDCGTVFGGAYFCGICKLFDDVDKGQFHCDGCGICRIGGREKFSHCDTCGLCLPAGKSHKCVSNTSHNNCPVCLEDIHTSRLEAHIPPCSHLLHLTCYQDMVRTGLYACPTCGLSMQDMSMVWADIDREVASTPMPREYAGLYREILCKDCNQTGTATFHIVGMKCLSCGSYNTTLDKGPLLRLVSKEGEEKVFTPLTETEIGTLTRGLTMRMVGRRLRRWARRMVKWLQIQTLERWLKKIWTDFLRMIAYLLGIER